MGGKGGDNGLAMQQQAGQNAYSAAGQGQSLEQIIGSQPDYASASQHGYNTWLAEQPKEPFQMPEFSFGMPSSQVDEVDYEARYQSQQEDAAKIRGESLVNELYRSKFAAANKATETVNQQVIEEASYANVSGADYSITPEQKAERINNMFASLWSSQQDTELTGLESKWGAGENRWTSGVIRGIDSASVGALKEGAKAGQGVDPGRVFGVVEETEDELLGGGAAILGGV